MSKVSQFLSEVKAEFKNITWPTKDTLLQLSIVVISVSLIISAILGGFDYLFTRSFSLLNQLKNMPAPSQPIPTSSTPPVQIENVQTDN